MPLIWLLLALFSAAPQSHKALQTTPSASLTPPPPLFTIDERAADVAYWNARGREAIKMLPARVSLTPEASLWFSAYRRASHAMPAPADLTDWDAWVNAKLARDRWDALQIAGGDSSAAPPAPGVIPASLLAAAGDPPPLEAAIVPRQYTIDLGDGQSPLTYTDHIRFGPRYASYRSATGVMSGGTPLRVMPSGELDSLFAAVGLTPFERHVVQAVSILEGGFDAVNTYDTGFVSVGFIQFITSADGTGSLAQVLLQEKTTRPDDFARDFHRRGIDVSRDGILTVVDPGTGAELTGHDAVAKVIADPCLVAAFQAAGQSSVAFRTAQIVVAKRAYYPAADPLIVTLPDGTTLTGTVSDVIHSEAGMATLFDRKVNTGRLDPLPTVVAQVMAAHTLKTWSDLAPYEREIVAAMKYRTDFLADSRLAQPQKSPAGVPAG